MFCTLTCYLIFSFLFSCNVFLCITIKQKKKKSNKQTKYQQTEEEEEKKNLHTVSLLSEMYVRQSILSSSYKMPKWQTMCSESFLLPTSNFFVLICVLLLFLNQCITHVADACSSLRSSQSDSSHLLLAKSILLCY